MVTRPRMNAPMACPSFKYSPWFSSMTHRRRLATRLCRFWISSDFCGEKLILSIKSVSISAMDASSTHNQGYTTVWRQRFPLTTSTQTHPMYPVSKLRLSALALNCRSTTYTTPPTAATVPRRRTQVERLGGGFFPGPDPGPAPELSLGGSTETTVHRMRLVWSCRLAPACRGGRGLMAG